MIYNVTTRVALLCLAFATLFVAVNGNHEAGVNDPNGDEPNICPGKDCKCQYNCENKCHCNGHSRNLGANSANGPDCNSYQGNKRHCYTDPNACEETFVSSTEKMPGTDIAMHWAYAACDNVDQQKMGERLEQCIEECQAEGFGDCIEASYLNVVNITGASASGNNQMFACKHACLMRYDGEPAASCKELCKRNGESGCNPTVQGRAYHLCVECSIDKTMPRAGFTLVSNGGSCDAQNEICGSDSLPCKGASHVECCRLCSAEPTCVSWEWGPSNQCQLSTSCTVDPGNDDGDAGWQLWVKNEYTEAEDLAVNPWGEDRNAHTMRGCNLGCDAWHVDCVETQKQCTSACEKYNEREYTVVTPPNKNGKACVGPTDCVPGEDMCSTTTNATATTESITTATTTATTTTTTTIAINTAVNDVLAKVLVVIGVVGSIVIIGVGYWVAFYKKQTPSTTRGRRQTAAAAPATNNPAFDQRLAPVDDEGVYSTGLEAAFASASFPLYGRIVCNDDDDNDDYGDCSDRADYDHGSAATPFADILSSLIEQEVSMQNNRLSPTNKFKAAITSAAKSTGDRNADTAKILRAVESSLAFGARVHRKQSESNTLPNCALTPYDIAVIHSYTVETKLYLAVNDALRFFGENTTTAAGVERIRPFLPFIDLFTTALRKLPPVREIVFRGVRKSVHNLIGSKKGNDKIIFHGFTSATLSADVLRSANFLGIGAGLGARTVFQFAAVRGRCISAYSESGPNGSTSSINATHDEDEVLLLPGAAFIIDKDGVTPCANGITEVRAAQLNPDGSSIYDDVQNDSLYATLYEDIGLPSRHSSTSNRQPARGRAQTSAAAGMATQAGARCKQCNAKPQFCACNVRRNTAGMARRCKVKTSKGPCTNMALPKSGLCGAHTCGRVGCKASKPSKAAFCAEHAAAEKKRRLTLEQRELFHFDPTEPKAHNANASAVYAEPSAEQIDLYDEGSVPGASAV